MDNKHVSSEGTILELKNISKAFPGVQALDNVSLDIRKGEILAILGENGAGKSTLMKILSGLYQADSGEIFVNSDWFKSTETEETGLIPIILSNPRMAMKMGIGMVYQHFQLVEPFTVAENIMVGEEITFKNTGFIDQKQAESQIRELSESYGLPINPNAMVEDLSVGLKQRVEILKQLYRDAELLILDEPTAVLTPTEVEELFKTMRKLKEAGKSLIFISHKLREPLAIADRIVVVRRGKYVGETFPKDATQEILAEMVVGRKIIKQLDRQKLPFKTPVLEVSNLNMINSEEELILLKDINFTIHANQIVGVAGVQGNGQTELVDALIGLRQIDTGEIIYYRNKYTTLYLHELDVLNRLKSGIGYIPEDRSVQGLISSFTISENSWMSYYGNNEEENQELSDRLGISHDGESEKEGIESPSILDRMGDFGEFIKGINEKYELNEKFSKLTAIFMLPKMIMERLADFVVNNFDVMAPSIETKISTLSGGNQQKVLLGREFSKDPKLIIASQPTRGVDIGVMEKVHQQLIRKRNEGAAVLLISSDLDEVLTLSDYIIVMYEGEIAGAGNIQDMSVSEISQLMTRGKIIEEAAK